MNKNNYRAPFEDKTIDIGHGLTVHIEWQEDYGSDLSYLQQTDAKMGDGFEKYARRRLAALDRGDWCPMLYIARLMLGDTVIATDACGGIDSDSGAEYIHDTEREAIAELRAMAGERLKEHERKLRHTLERIEQAHGSVFWGDLTSKFYGAGDYWYTYDPDNTADYWRSGAWAGFHADLTQDWQYSEGKE